MRVFSIFATAVAFAFSVNAASYNKRVISNGNTCDASLSRTNTEITAFHNHMSLDASYTGSIHYSVSQFVVYLKNAGTDCCGAPAKSAEETDALTKTFGYTTFGLLDIFSTFIGKRLDFVSTQSAYDLVSNDIKLISSAVKNLDACLLTAISDSHHSEVQNYVSSINQGLDGVFNEYQIAN